MSAPLEANGARNHREWPLPTAKWVTITPEVAESMLKGPNIRQVRKPTLDKYIRQLKEGTWWMNGETIKFDASGLLVDGQHRLLAVMQTKIAIVALVVYGVTSKGVDEGRQRTVSDLLGGRGAGHAETRAAVLRIIYCLANSERLRPFQGAKLANAELLDWMETLDQEGMARSCTIACGMHKRYPAAITGAIAYQIRKHTECEHFFELLATGENIGTGHAVFELRRWVETRRESGRGFHSEPGRRLCYHAIAAAWSAFVEPGKPITARLLSMSGDKPAVLAGCDPLFAPSWGVGK